jgi:hypothetical protein
LHNEKTVYTKMDEVSNKEIGKTCPGKCFPRVNEPHFTLHFRFRPISTAEEGGVGRG